MRTPTLDTDAADFGLVAHKLLPVSPHEIDPDVQGYTPDACMTDPMTALQSIRMQAMWNAYRSTFSASGQAGVGAFHTPPPPDLPRFKTLHVLSDMDVHLRVANLSLCTRVAAQGRTATLLTGVRMHAVVCHPIIRATMSCPQPPCADLPNGCRDE